MMTTPKTACLILAAGKGTRMKSEKAKVLHEIFFAPMIHHVLEAVGSLSIGPLLVVVGHQRENVLARLSGYTFTPVIQEKQQGTGHAVLCAEPYLTVGQSDTLLILCGDIPLIRPETLSAMLSAHRASGAKITVMTTLLENPTGYGRIIRNTAGVFEKIVEEKDASTDERSVCEINAGIYCADIPFLFAALTRVGTANRQGEMYLTDIVSIAREMDQQVNTYTCPDFLEVLGVNSRLELAQAHRELQRRRNEELMQSGVTLLGEESIYIENSVSIGADTSIHPNVRITGKTSIGGSCTILSNSVIHDCAIGDQVTINYFANLNGKNIPR